MGINKSAEEYRKKLPDYDIKRDLRILSSALIKIRCQYWTYKENDLVMWNERQRFQNETDNIQG